MAVTETNIAYRTAEYLKNQDLDFVVGIEIHLSGNHTYVDAHGVLQELTDICDELAGRYPKEFKWTGWHPQCRCTVLRILKTEEEVMEDNKRAINGEEIKCESVNKVTDMPDNFNKWVDDNQDRIQRAKSLPYFVRDNEKFFPQMNITNSAVEGVREAQGFNENLIALSDTHKQNHKGIIKTIYPELTDKVIEVENNIRENAGFETAVAFGKNGNIAIDKRGVATSVTFTDNECEMMKDCILTHNHPRGWKAKENTIGRIGNSFSYEDISLSVNRNVAEIRAITPTYTFSIKRPINGWCISDRELKEDFDLANQNIQNKMNEIINKTTSLKNEQQAVERANALHFHLIWKELSKKYGWEYTKSKSIL